MIDELKRKLESQASWEEINSLGHKVFYEGNLDRLDEFFSSIIPIVNITYYKYIAMLDDRGYAKEDLIQDAMLEIYKDITLRWDKYIYVDDYFNYFKIVCKNVMTSLVFVHHNYYKNVEFDPDIRNDLTDEYKYSNVDANIHKEYLQTSMVNLALKLANNRKGYSKVLTYLINWKFVEKNTDINALKSRVNVSWWLKRSDINFLLDHASYLYRLSFNYYLALEKGNTNMVKRLEQIINRFEDSTYSILSKKYGNSIIPEIYAEFGPENTKRFVKLFSGKHIDVPDYTEFCDDMVGNSLLSLVNDKDDLYEIALNYKLSYKKLLRIYERAIKNKEDL